jgi:hypothetical protein
MGWIGCIAIFIGWIVRSPETVYAQDHRMTDMHMDVKLLEDGSAIITETRRMELTEDGTELYILFDENELNGSEISDFEVTGYEYQPDWDLNASFDEKALKYGMEETSDGIELIWGMSEYGTQEYVLTYTITNVVRELEDGQALQWDFQSFYDIPPENFSLEIEGPVPFDETNTDIWGFGFDGEIGLEAGRLFWETNEPLEAQQDVIVLMQFLDEPFSPMLQEDLTLLEQQERAEAGSGYNTAESSDLWKWIVGGIGALVIGGIAWAISVAKGLYKREHLNSMINDYRKENKDKELREPPYKTEEIADLAYILHNPYLQAGSFEDIFYASLLKWSVQDAIHIETEEEQKMFRTVHTATIEIQDFEEERSLFPADFEDYVEDVLNIDNDLSYESALWFMLLSAADMDGRVTNERMKKWAKKHAKEVEELADGLKEYSKDRLEKEGYITINKESVAGFKMDIIAATHSGKELINRLFQFKNYLEGFSLKEAASIDKGLPWEELVIWAAIFGEEAEEILEELEEFFPEFYDELSTTYPHFYYGHVGYTGFRRSWSDGLTSGGYHASSGAGGMTSAGGGAGASGGASGGGAR